MKMLILLTAIGVANLALIVTGEAILIWRGATSDLWKRECRYYYPVRLYSVQLPLSQGCPRWRTTT